jgi:hypothetical protein
VAGVLIIVNFFLENAVNYIDSTSYCDLLVASIWRSFMISRNIILSLLLNLLIQEEIVKRVS